MKTNKQNITQVPHVPAYISCSIRIYAGSILFYVVEDFIMLYTLFSRRHFVFHNKNHNMKQNHLIFLCNQALMINIHFPFQNNSSNHRFVRKSSIISINFPFQEILCNCNSCISVRLQYVLFYIRNVI